MHVVIHLSKCVDLVAVPRDVVVTDQDIASGRVIPGRDPGTYRVQIIKEPKGGTFRTCTINEEDILGKIVHEKADVKRAGRTFSRRQAVAHLIQDMLLDGHDWSWITKVEVHDDGPDEALFDQIVAPHTKSPHARRSGQMVVNPAHLEEMRTAYMESTTATDHADHLHGHFGVRKAVSK